LFHTKQRKAPAKAKVRSRDDTMAHFVDVLAADWIDIEELFQRASAESAKRGVGRFTSRRKFDRYIAARERSPSVVGRTR